MDLYLMHWPSSTDPEDLKKHLPDWDFVKTWAEMQKLPASGRVRSEMKRECYARVQAQF